MSFSQFDVLGDDVFDKTGEMVAAGDPRRALVRYRPDGGELFVSARINLPLLKAAADLPVLLLKPASREDEVLKPIDPALLADGGWDLLTVAGLRRNGRLLERICRDVAGAAPACYLADRHGADRRDFYFAAEDAADLERIAQAAAAALSFPLSVERLTLAQAAPIILPTEAIGVLGLEIAAQDLMRPTRFEFRGAEPSLATLRARLEALDFRSIGLDRGQGELRMIKTTPIDGPGFRAVLKQIAPLARALGCSYRGAETLEGPEAFALDRPLPDRYAADKPAGLFDRVFGMRRA